jgi:hypothetical protein
MKRKPIPTSSGDPRFLAVLEEIATLHRRKCADYGVAGDPFQNIRASAEFGIPPHLGAILRGNDKVQRLKAFAKNGSLANESAEDSLLDLAAYSIIALVLLREEKTP